VSVARRSAPQRSLLQTKRGRIARILERVTRKPPPPAEEARVNNPNRSYEELEREAIQIDGRSTTAERERIEAQQWAAGRRRQQGVLAHSSPLAAERARRDRADGGKR
jgi:hypothetical protein